MSDPFIHHPELRDKINNPEDSVWRTIDNEFLTRHTREHNLPQDWCNSDEIREALRQRALEGRKGKDLWVFGYGSLMWDPAIHFAEVRRACVEGYKRRLILAERYGGRGNKETPGMLAALDKSTNCKDSHCKGLAFRIEASLVEEETYKLWQREQITPGYNATFLPAKTGHGMIDTLCFIADHSAETIIDDMSIEEQIRCIATARGTFGSSLDYLRDLVKKLEQLDIEDAEIRALLVAAEQWQSDD